MHLTDIYTSHVEFSSPAEAIHGVSVFDLLWVILSNSVRIPIPLWVYKITE